MLYSYMIFNEINLTFKSVMSTKKPKLTDDHLSVLYRTHTDFKKSKTREIVVQMGSGGRKGEKMWLCGLKSGKRLVYFCLVNDNINLGNLQEEIDFFKASLTI